MTIREIATTLSVLTLFFGASACGGSDDKAKETLTEIGEDGVERLADQGRCGTEGEDLEVSEYDTSGDDHADVRKVFRRFGKGRLTRLVMICREVDLNADGRKDLVRFYDDEGSPIREEADRDFDGTYDAVLYFDNGQIQREEVDASGNGRVDTKIFFENGKPLRSERDLAGRSTDKTWRPDRWEYFEDERLVRIGTDLDGDGKVDRWDRDEAYRPKPAELGADEEETEESE